MKANTVAVLGTVLVAAMLTLPIVRPSGDAPHSNQAGRNFQPHHEGSPVSKIVVKFPAANRPQHDRQASEKTCAPELRYLDTEQGTPAAVILCNAPADQASDPYAVYSDQTLAVLAYADARAAETLGMRLRTENPDTALEMTLRAVALSGGDAEPIIAFANAYPVPAKIDGIPVKSTVFTRYFLSAVADLLGDERSGVSHWERQLHRVTAKPHQDRARLQRRASEAVDRMREIEIAVTGFSTFGGQNGV